MPTIMPNSELVRRAIAFINDQLREHPQKDLHELMNEAGMRFNLSPRDAMELEHLCRNRDCPKS